jgi:electron transport complex protein RnfD
MLSFASQLGSSAYQAVQPRVHVVTQATPLTIAKEGATAVVAAEKLWPLFLGTVNGSLGEVSALALLLGGLYLCVRRVAAWEIPLGVVLAAGILAGLANWAGLTPFTALHHLLAGALLFGAFFIATDPVTSPLTGSGQFFFGLGIGTAVMVIRLFSGYPEGVMFAVLLMNAVVPLLNHWTIPRPLGGPMPAKT